MRLSGVSAKVSATGTLLNNDGASIWYQFFAFHRSLTFLEVVRARALAIRITYTLLLFNERIFGVIELFYLNATRG
jgi:hypothetical protein